MASEGPLYAGAGANDNSAGGDAWNNPGRIVADDGSDAQGSGSSSTQYLVSSSHGFSIPSGATIDGIVVEVGKRDGCGLDISDLAARIVKGGTISTTDRSLGGNWAIAGGGGDVNYTYGSSSDLWGETWTDSDINASGFGFAIRGDSTSACCNVDYIRITVYYTEAAAGQPAVKRVAGTQFASRVVPEMVGRVW